jgi:hypothetical protein
VKGNGSRCAAYSKAASHFVSPDCGSAGSGRHHRHGMVSLLKPVIVSLEKLLNLIFDIYVVAHFLTKPFARVAFKRQPIKAADDGIFVIHEQNLGVSVAKFFEVQICLPISKIG